MAPFGLVTASVSLLAKSFNFFTCTNTLARVVVRTAYRNQVKCLSTQASERPKKPLNGYMRYVMQQKPILASQNPDVKIIHIVSKIAQEWRVMKPEQKQPYEDAFLLANEQFKKELQRYKDQLTPAQIEQQVIEKRDRLARTKAIRKKREATTMGKPKRPRSAFNIYMSEHFEEAKGENTQAKMKTLSDEWRNILGNQKQVYTQLAEDDKIRYKNEIKSWEEHMMEIGRNDLLRDKTISSQKRQAAQAEKAKIKKKVKKLTPKAKSRTAKKTKSTVAKAAKKTKKT